MRPDLTGRHPELLRRIEAAEAALATDEADAAAWRELATLYHANGYGEPALQAYVVLRQLEPADARWHYLPGVLLAGYGRMEEAEGLLRRAAELAPEMVAVPLELAELLIKTNRPAEADAAYRRALELEPESPWALHGLARVAAEDGRWPEARRWLERATALHPEFFSANNLLATTYEKLGMTDAAEAPRRRARAADRHRDPPDPCLDALALQGYDVYQLQVKAAASGDPERARALLGRALKLDPNDARTWRQLGLVLLRLGDRPAARQHLEEAVAREPDETPAYLDLLVIYKLDDDLAAARRLLEAGLQRQPSAAGLHYEMALLENAADRPEQAIEHLQAARRAAPEQLAASAELARQYFRLGQESEAVAVLDDAIRRDPGHGPTLLLLARYHVIGGREPAAAELLQRLTSSGAAPTAEHETVRREFAARFRRPAP